MPDNTFQNPKIVLCIIGIIDRLPIGKDIVKESDLETVLGMYKNGEARDPGYSECQQLSKTVLNKWYRKKHNIQTTYDPEGRFDDGWRNLQKQLDKERVREVEEDEDEPSKKRQKKAPEEDDSLG